MHYFVVETKIMFSQYIYIRPAIHHLIPHSFIRKKRKKKIQAMILGKKVSHPKKKTYTQSIRLLLPCPDKEPRNHKRGEKKQEPESPLSHHRIPSKKGDGCGVRMPPVHQPLIPPLYSQSNQTSRDLKVLEALLPPIAQFLGIRISLLALRFVLVEIPSIGGTS
jgi:hypothetical protein